MALELLATTAFTDNAAAPFIDEDGSQSSSFRCNFDNCNREFNSKRNLVDHYRGHHQGKRPHACNYAGCGKSFLRPAHLLIHTRIHTGEKPFVCIFPGCGKRWNQKSALKQHIRSHTGEKPFVCSVAGCNKRFSTSSSCKRHVLTHEKGYVAANVPLNLSTSKRKVSDAEFSSSEDEALSFKRSRSASPDLSSSPVFSSGSSSPAPSSPTSSTFQSSIADLAAVMPEDDNETPADTSDLSVSLGKMAMNFILN